MKKFKKIFNYKKKRQMYYAYRNAGKFDEDIKTVIEEVVENHSYDTPCVISIPILSGNKIFLEWVNQQTNTG